MRQIHRVQTASLCLSVFICLGVMLSGTGCSSTYYVAPERSSVRGDTVTVAVFNEKFLDRSAVVSDLSARAFPASDVRLTRDSCSFLVDGDQQRRSLPLNMVKSVTRKERIGSAVGGLFIGLFGGGALGAGIMGAGGSGDGAGAGVALGLAGGAAVGTLSGVIIGAMVGSTIEYRLWAPGHKP